MMRVSLSWVLGLVLLAGAPAHASDALSAAAGQVAGGDYRAALATLDRLEGGAAGGALPLFLRAAALAGTGRLDEAALLFERLIAAHPELPEAYNNLAALRAQQGKLAEAKALLERALRTDERYSTVYENLSTIYVEMARGSYAKALRMETGAQPPRLTVLTSLTDTSPPVPLQQVVATAVASVPAPVVPQAAPAEEPVPVSLVPSAAPAGQAAPPAGQPAPTAPPVVEPPASNPAAVTVTEPSVADVPESLRLAVVTALNGWAKAWSQQDMDAYLAYYDADYAPEGVARDAWEEERRTRITRPAWIKVKLEDIRVEVPLPDQAVVTLRQRYVAAGYKDTTLKRLTLALRDGNWVITTETSLKVQR
jgi:tetratricopeptide (TPR) repeat protein